jgi:hypothetical protein
MAEFILASRRNDGQETKDGSGDFTGKEEKISFKKFSKKFSGKSNDYFPNISQEKDPPQNLLKASESKVKSTILDLFEASKSNNKASQSKVKKAIRDLFEVYANASVDPRDTHGCTPLMFTAEKGSVHGLDYLVNARADVNAYNNKGETSIIIATMHNQYKAVKALLGHDADITLADCGGDTALTHTQTQKLNISKAKQSQKAIQKQKNNHRIEDLLYTRLGHDQVKNAGLNDHICENHCGNGQQVVSVYGTESRQANNGDIKTIFPSRWSKTKTLTAVTSILYSPEELRRESGYNPARFVAEGKFEGVPIRVVMEKKDFKSNVITAFPIRD